MLFGDVTLAAVPLRGAAHPGVVTTDYVLDDAMRRELLDRPIDHAIAALAERQHGAVARHQLLALGLHPRAIDRRIAAGRLHVLYRGVYAVGDRCLPPLGRLMAAVLASGRSAVASHRSAAMLHELRPYQGQPHVSAVPGARPRPGIQLTQAELEPDEITVVQCIPTTTVARTLLDLGAVDGRLVDKAVRQAEFLGVFDLCEVARLLERYPRRRGTARLRKAIHAAADSEVRTRSDMEDAFHALVLDANLPRPEINDTVELGEITIEADAVWRDARLIVELDSRQAHATHYAFEADRERDRLAALEGWTVIRITWRQLVEKPRRLVRDLARLLRERTSN
jgi:very-short-patch-repair endonuclease